VVKSGEKTLQYALYGLISLGILFTLYAVVSTNVLSGLFQNAGSTPTPVPSASVSADQPKIGIVLIKPPSCRPCVDLKSFADSMKNAGDVQILSQETIAFENASDLIAKYGIKKLPTVIITGDTSKIPGLLGQWTQIGEVKSDGALVLTKIPPVYYDLDQKKFIGLLKIVRLVNSTCFGCTKASVLQGDLEASAGLKFSEESEVEINTTQGKTLISQYDLTKIPALIISGEVSAYPVLTEGWPKVGTTESDGSLVWRLVTPPYQELPSNRLRGLATLIGIRNETCKSCYDITVHERIFGAYGVLFGNTTYLNYTRPWAKELVQKYNITFLPTVLVDRELEEYYPFVLGPPSLEQIWNQVGSTEPDGWHVFRNMSVLGGNLTFQNLTSGKIETTPLENATAVDGAPSNSA